MTFISFPSCFYAFRAEALLEIVCIYLPSLVFEPVQRSDIPLAAFAACEMAVVRTEAVAWIISVDVPPIGFQFVRRSTVGDVAVMAFDVPVERAVVPALELVALPAVVGGLVVGGLVGRVIDGKACVALVADDEQLMDFPVAHLAGSLSTPLTWSQSQDRPPCFSHA